MGALLLLSAAAQTITTNVLPTGTVCGGIENCQYTIHNGSQSGIFEVETWKTYHCPVPTSCHRTIRVADSDDLTITKAPMARLGKFS